MFWEFRKKVYRNFLLKLLIVFLGAYLLILLLVTDNFVNDALMKFLTYSGIPIEIDPGEDLSVYAYENVRCTFKYVINPVTNLYDEEVSDQIPYACGYIVLDDNRENPFCVFVPLSKWEQMEALMEETWRIERGESNGENMSPVTVEGRVRSSEKEIYNHYLDALHYLYGEDYVFSKDEVFYIDDGSSVAGYEQDEDDALLVIGFLFIVIFYGTIAYTIIRIIQTLFWQKPVRRFIKENNLSKEELEREFSLAEKVAPSFWISPQYTFFVKDVEVKIIKNDDLVRSYMEHSRGIISVYSVVLQTQKKQKYKSGVLRKNGANQILEYYQEKFSHVSIGNEKEK